MKIIEEYRRLTEEIAALESALESAERELLKQTNQYKPRFVKAIDYSEEKVQTSTTQQDMIATYKAIEGLKKEIDDLRRGLTDAKKQKSSLEKVINDVGENKKKALMLLAQGKKHKEIARIMSIDIRHVFRLLKQGREEIRNRQRKNN